MCHELRSLIQYDLIIQEKKFKYWFVPTLDFMQSFTITRQNNIMTPNDVTIHFHPFRTLPLLESHLRPEFVMLEVGRKLKKYRKLARTSEGVLIALEVVTTHWPFVTKIENIYEAWMRPLPDGALESPILNPPANSNDNERSGTDDSLHTEPRRSRKHDDAKQESQNAALSRKRKRDH